MSACARSSCRHGSQRHHHGPCMKCDCPEFVFPKNYGQTRPLERNGSRHRRVLDKDATIALLKRLQPGDRPLEPGDEFHHPDHGAMTVSRVVGWERAWHIAENEVEGDHSFQDIGRVFVVTAVREGRKRPERLLFCPSKPESPTSAEQSAEGGRN